MSLPNKIRAALGDASISVQQDPEHDLAPRFRWNLQNLIFEARNKEPRSDKAGHKAWLRVEITTVRHVLPLWQQKHPHDDTPQKLLREAETFLSDSLEVGKAELMAFSFPEDTGTRNPVDQVLSGAIATLVFAILASARPESFVSSKRDMGRSNRQLEFPHDWDASLCACVAYTGDASLLAEASRAKRLEFWQWWLDVAIPQAYEKRV
jgi:hypothetical protein